MSEVNYRLAPELLMRRPGDAFDGIIIKLWRGSNLAPGLNTYQIARFAQLPERFVANRLAVIRDAAVAA